MHPLLLKAGISAAALATGAGFAVSGSGSPAVALSSPPLYLAVTIQTPATLVDFGAAVHVPVWYNCGTGGDGHLTVSVTERVGWSTAFGSTSTVVRCTGRHETVVTIVPSTNGVYYAMGSAIAQASLSECTWYDCAGAQHTANIEIR